MSWRTEEDGGVREEGEGWHEEQGGKWRKGDDDCPILDVVVDCKDATKRGRGRNLKQDEGEGRQEGTRRGRGWQRWRRGNRQSFRVKTSKPRDKLIELTRPFVPKVLVKGGDGVCRASLCSCCRYRFRLRAGQGGGLRHLYCAVWQLRGSSLCRETTGLLPALHPFPSHCPQAVPAIPGRFPCNLMVSLPPRDSPHAPWLYSLRSCSPLAVMGWSPLLPVSAPLHVSPPRPLKSPSLAAGWPRR